ncbi:AAA15 family ATPase/GTPase [Methanocalculus alkaliphilus]|uniref:AAA family ATPase n=1 Tax=Methanocalculus alkaliphilus TaxID=768730 RepID=UPI0020A08051|nr:AAA family ATPase [Methanocalculus alkaliphilus]MCP1715819.1 AAA15 family ATPase/GTPase [Methanocalculus alkaliphilus]
MGRITKLHIENFRAIGSLDYTPHQLNIICGKNNTGKSALLDAIYISEGGDGAERRSFEEGKTPNFIKDGEPTARILSDRNEITIYRSLDIYRKAQPDSYTEIREYLLSMLLEDLEYYDDEFQEAYLKIILDSHEFIIIRSGSAYTVIPYNLSERQIITEQLREIIEDAEERQPQHHQSDDPGITTKRRRIRPVSAYRMLTTSLSNRFGHYQPFKESSSEIEQPIIKISHREKLSIKKMADEEIHLLEQFIKEHNLVRDLLRLTQDNVLYRRGDRIETVPISAHGDGFITLLSILYHLRRATDGILLIEEPENHLHPEYLTILIETLFTYAPELNVQVFMTTHSYDLIQIALEYPEDEAEKELLLISKMASDGVTIEKFDYTVDEGRRVIEDLKLDLRGI